jgi:5-methyltetrahydropteroyltriglutamate--homocysteine methyltransferase
MPIATEPIGSIPRPPRLIQAVRDLEAGGITASEYNVILDESIRDTIGRFEATGSPVITDGEQGKPSFATYPIVSRYTTHARLHRRQALRMAAGLHCSTSESR